MKTCKEIGELISKYLEDELDELNRDEFEEHIDSCVDCKNELEAVREVLYSLEEIDEVELPIDFKETLHEKLVLEQQKKENKSKSLLINYKYIKAVSSIAAVLLIIFVARGFLITGLLIPSKSSNTDRQYTALENNTAGNSAGNSEPMNENSLFFNESVEDNLEYNAKVKDNKSEEKGLAAEFDIKGHSDSEVEKRITFSGDQKVQMYGDTSSGNGGSTEKYNDVESTEKYDDGEGTEKYDNGEVVATTIEPENADIVIKTDTVREELDKLEFLASRYIVELVMLEPQTNDMHGTNTDNGNIKLNFSVEAQNYEGFIEGLKQEFLESVEIINQTNIKQKNPGETWGDEENLRGDDGNKLFHSNSDVAMVGGRYEEVYIEGFIIIENKN